MYVCTGSAMQLPVQRKCIISPIMKHSMYISALFFISQINIDENNVECSFYTTPKMSSCLVTVVVTEYKHKTVVSPLGVKVGILDFTLITII